MKIAIIGPIHEDGYNILKNARYDFFEINNFKANFLKSNLHDVDGIILRTAKLSKNILSKCKKLKIIVRHGVGYDNVDLKYLNSKKIALGITSTSNAVSVAEHVLTCFLSLTKNLHLSDSLTRKGNFNKKSELPNFFEIYQKNILILGFGRIGQAVAKRCLGFEAKVYVCDPYVSQNFIKKKHCIPINKLEGFKIADYITIHLPLNKKTKNLISKKEFNIFKKNLILVNTARGGVIDEKALFEALKNKKISAAAIDVYEKEPPSIKNSLFSLDNIIFSPHNAALTIECRKRMSVETCETIINYLKKNKKLNYNNIVNKDKIGII